MTAGLVLALPLIIEMDREQQLIEVRQPPRWLLPLHSLYLTTGSLRSFAVTLTVRLRNAVDCIRRARSAGGEPATRRLDRRGAAVGFGLPADLVGTRGVRTRCTHVTKKRSRGEIIYIKEKNLQVIEKTKIDENDAECNHN